MRVSVCRGVCRKGGKNGRRCWSMGGVCWVSVKVYMNFLVHSSLFACLCVWERSVVGVSPSGAGRSEEDDWSRTSPRATSFSSNVRTQQGRVTYVHGVVTLYHQCLRSAFSPGSNCVLVVCFPRGSVSTQPSVQTFVCAQLLIQTSSQHCHDTSYARWSRP